MPALPLPERYRVKRPVTRRRVIATALGVVLVVVAAFLFQRSDSDGSASSIPDLSATPRSPLESRLLEHSSGVLCADGPDFGWCAEFEATAVACASRSVRIDGRRWHRCRVRSAPNPQTDPPRERVETVCAALNPSGGYTPRPLPDCPPA